jgi:hypothetical protein
MVAALGLALLLSAEGCRDGVGVRTDYDGDGDEDAVDCAPADASIHHGAADPWGDGIDQDCDGADGIDRDGDGSPGNEELADQPELYDCNDTAADVHPGAPDPAGDEVDQDCDGNDGYVELTVEISPEEPDTTDALTVSWEMPAGEGLAVDVAWFVDDEEEPELAGALEVGAERTSKGQIWRVEVTPMAGERLLFGSRVAATVVIRNAVPTLGALEITPAVLSEAGPAVALASGVSDADVEDSPVVRYRWSVDGVEVPGFSSDSLPPSQFDKHESVEVAAWATDGSDEGEALAAGPVEVANTAPSAVGVEIWPAAIFETSLVTAAFVGWEDHDPADAQQGSTLSWFVDGVFVTSGEELGGEWFGRGQEISVEALPFDGEDVGAMLAAGPVLVQDSAPVLAGLQIAPGSPLEGSVLSAVPLGLLDADPGDAASLSLLLTWTVDGAPAGSAATLTGATFDRGDVVGLLATPWDGTLSGVAVAATPVLIGNSAPELAGVAIVPLGATVEEPYLLAETEGWSDADGDLEATSFVWTINGVEAGSAVGGLLPSGTWVKGDLVELLATPWDGLDAGEEVAASLEIANAAPSITGVEVSPASGNESTLFVATVQGWADADGDPEGASFVWLVNGVPGPVTDWIDGASFDRGDQLTLEVTAWDGESLGNTMTWGPTTVLDAPPLVAGVTLGPEEIFTDSLALCAAVEAGDPDGDEVLITWTWERNGLELLAPNAPDLDGEDWFGRGDVLRCKVEASDGQSPPAEAWSPAVTVLNSPPAIADAGILQSIAYTTTELSCLPSGWDDADGDPAGYAYGWAIDGVPVLGAEEGLLDPAFTEKGDSVVCEITPNDGIEDGWAVASDPILIANMPPTAAVLAWDPPSPEVGNDLGCVINVPASDADGDPISYEWTWFLDQVEEPSITGGTVPGAMVGVGDRWTCVVRAWDGEVFGPEGEREMYFGAGFVLPSVILSTDMVALTALGTDMNAGDTLSSLTHLRQQVADPPYPT